MTTLDLSHRRTHHLLLLSKLLNLRDNASPFTLVLDSLEQPASVFLCEYIRRANLLRSPVIYVAYETLRRPHGVDSFIAARKKFPSQISEEISQLTQGYARAEGPKTICLIIIDSLQPLSITSDLYLPTYLSSLLISSNAIQISLVAVYHTDVPLDTPFIAVSGYSPHPLTLLNYLATTIITLHSFAHYLAMKAARDQSLVAPPQGIEEGKGGVLVGLRSVPLSVRKGDDMNSVLSSFVIEMEHRRKSGRSIDEWYYLKSASGSIQSLQAGNSLGRKENFNLLDDHPLLSVRGSDSRPSDNEPESTFLLSLTDRQRQERDGVVLPYFDAQKLESEGEGGRILYDMGVEDDFDEEEDEI